MRWFIYSIIALVLIVLQGIITTIPLLIGWVLYIAVSERPAVVCFFSFLAGILLDSLTFHPIGASSIFFICMLLLVYLYQRKFEVKSVLFICAASFVSSLVYQYLFGSVYIFQSSLVNALFASGIFGINRKINPKF